MADVTTVSWRGVDGIVRDYPALDLGTCGGEGDNATELYLAVDIFHDTGVHVVKVHPGQPAAIADGGMVAVAPTQTVDIGALASEVVRLLQAQATAPAVTAVETDGQPV